jgi:hypothetical protein
MCTWILSLVIVSAFEAEPGWMTIEHLLPNESIAQPSVVETIYVPTNQYLECYDNISF